MNEENIKEMNDEVEKIEDDEKKSKCTLEKYLSSLNENIHYLNCPMTGELDRSSMKIFISKPKGKLIKRMGTYIDNKLALIVEEALYLIIKGYLQLRSTSNSLSMTDSMMEISPYVNMDTFQVYKEIAEKFCVKKILIDKNTFLTTYPNSNLVTTRVLFAVYSLNEIPSKKNNHQPKFYILVCGYDQPVPDIFTLQSLIKEFSMPHLKLGFCELGRIVFIDIDATVES